MPKESNTSEGESGATDLCVYPKAEELLELARSSDPIYLKISDVRKLEWQYALGHWTHPLTGADAIHLVTVKV